MSSTPGQDSGQPWDWASHLAWLVATHGSLAALATHLAEERGLTEDIESIARGLRRLRTRGSAEGGVWGQRVLRAFGVPLAVEDRVRWMGHYHTRFTDLPASLCLELLRPWDRPPVSETPARAWVQLGLASVALRRREPERAEEHLVRAESAATGAARVEALLLRAFVDSRGEPARVPALLDEAEAALSGLADDADRACLRARLVDQRGYELNVRRADPEAAHGLYEGLPDEGPPFALVRRHNGLGWSCLGLGRRDEAVQHAQRSVQHAGDGGSLRLRAMALNLLARVVGGTEGAAAHARALAIAERLEDEALQLRFRRTT